MCRSRTNTKSRGLVIISSSGEQVQLRYLQDANLSGFLIIAVLAGLDLSLEVTEPVGKKLFIQLVVVSLLTRDHQLFFLTRYLKRFANKLNTRLFFMCYPSLSHKRPPLPPVSSDSYDYGLVHSELGCHGVVLPVFPCVPYLSGPPSEPGELVTPLWTMHTETHADSKEQEGQRQKKKQNQWVICVVELQQLLTVIKSHTSLFSFSRAISCCRLASSSWLMVSLIVSFSLSEASRWAFNWQFSWLSLDTFRLDSSRSDLSALISV